MKRYVRQTTTDDVRYVVSRLRKADIAEIEAEGHFTPRQAMRYSVASSDITLTGVVGGEPVIIFGLVAPIYGDTGTIWALGTDECDRNPIAMVKFGRDAVKQFLKICPVLENYCDANYTRALNWLRVIGFEIGEEEPFGKYGNPFRKLTARRQ